MKQQIGKTNALYPSLTTILGTTVKGRPNFITIAHVGIMNHGDPQYLSFGVSKAHFSNKSGVLETSALKYWGIGEPVAGAWNAGKALKKKQNE